MILTFYRKIIRTTDNHQATPVEAKIVMADGERQTTLGTLNFPNQTVWAKFYGAVQTGALRIKDLTVVMENSKDDTANDDANDEAKLLKQVTKPTAVTKMVVGIGIGTKERGENANANTGPNTK